MIDIHVIKIPSTNEEWLDICLKSLVHPDVTVHIVEGEVGHTGRSRAKGYLMGTNPYVAYVDPDDYLTEGAIDLIKPYLEKHGSIISKEIMIDEAGNDLKQVRSGHQLTVYKRSDITEKLLYCMERTSFTSEMYVKQAIQPVQVPAIAYVYRFRKSGSARSLHSKYAIIERDQWYAASTEWDLKNSKKY